MINGILLINKPKFITSYNVVSQIKKFVNQKKVGHAGTLDPLATGLLPILLGNATKISSFLITEHKEYIALLKLGIQTETQDITGNIINKSDYKINLNQFKEVLSSFVGLQKQIPPMFSAIKINGQKLYKLAYMGKVIDRKSREIQIYNIQLIKHNIITQEFLIHIKCSKGTYIRTLCNDIGNKLKTYGVLKSLMRINIGENFSIKKSYSLKKILSMNEEKINNILLSTEIIFQNLPTLNLNINECIKLKNGINLYLNEKKFEKDNLMIKIKYNNTFIMLAKIKYINTNFLITLYKNFVNLK